MKKTWKRSATMEGPVKHHEARDNGRLNYRKITPDAVRATLEKGASGQSYLTETSQVLHGGRGKRKVGDQQPIEPSTKKALTESQRCIHTKERVGCCMSTWHKYMREHLGVGSERSLRSDPVNEAVHHPGKSARNLVAALNA